MNAEDQNLDRVRQILKRMERSIDDARDRRLRDHSEEPDHSGNPRADQGHENSIPHGHGTTQHPSNTRQAQPIKPSQGPAAPGRAPQPVRFDEDGRPIVGRARAKSDRNNESQNGTPPNGAPSSFWR
ncbi:MAG: hypothetical protein ACTS3F_05860 [Phycisphaerales bacterium]